MCIKRTKKLFQLFNYLYFTYTVVGFVTKLSFYCILIFIVCKCFQAMDHPFNLLNQG